MIRSKNLYHLFVFIIYLFIFQFALMGLLVPFKYIDELYALLFIPLVAYRRFRLKESNFSIILVNMLYIAVGLLANVLYKYQVIQGILADALLNVKFTFGIFTTYLLFNKFDFSYYKKKIKRHIQIIVFILFSLVVIDEICGIFPCSEIRYGIRSEQLFFGHPTGLASVSFFLMLVLMLYYNGTRRDKAYVIMSCSLLISTLRAKAIAAFMVFSFLYIKIIIQKKRIKAWHFILYIPVVALFAWDQIYGYFFGAARMDMARGALLYRSFDIARDHFPLGSGMGTYASAPSGDYYSILYSKYGLSLIFGLTPEQPILVSDVFWPMILGQTGFIGLSVYIFLLYCLFKKIRKAYKIDRRYYFVGLGAMGYLFVSSIAESAFVNPLSLPLSILIGIVFSKIDRHKEILF